MLCYAMGGLGGALSMVLSSIYVPIRYRPFIADPFLRSFSPVSLCFKVRFAGKSIPIRNSPKIRRAFSREREMTVKREAWISQDRDLLVDGRTVLTDVPAEVTSTVACGGGGLFLGVEDLGDPAADTHVVTLGKLRDIRFLACFRFKLWWMTQRTGRHGHEVPLETQFLLLELPSSSSSSSAAALYAALLPLPDGPFRASLRGSADSSLLLSLESGDPSATAASSPRALLLGPALPDPFAAVSSAVSAACLHLGTFRPRHEKPLPPIVDLFGWCTWDAFYQDVSQRGVEDGLRSLSSGSAPPRFLIIDDGWQSVAPDADADAGNNKPPIMRLARAEENDKFKHGGKGIGHIVGVAKQRYGVQQVYAWHAIIGYWGGVGPTMMEEDEEQEQLLRFPKVSPGVDANEPGLKGEPMFAEGVGVVPPRSAFAFYDALHGYLSAEGVDGVKVDVQSVLETLGRGLGGRLALAGAYHEALDRSVAKHFGGTGIIACMSHSSDAIYRSKQTPLVRASDDFYPRDPVSHTIHIASVAYNSIFLGEFMLPDWDMFHSLHPAADYHASARAISGGPVYVSDAPGKHDFQLLGKLVLPDGTVLRARLPGRPTRDCLFVDPTRDGASLLKIWNMNRHTGVLGIYNCQGAAWCPTEKKNVFHATAGAGADDLTGLLKGDDVHLISEAATDPDWNGDCALYLHGDGQAFVLPCGAALPVSLKVLEKKIFTVTPIKVLTASGFAPFGLIEMYNSGGAIEKLLYSSSCGDTGESGLVEMEIKGCGAFGAYSSTEPRRCLVDSAEVEFSYDPASGLLRFDLGGMPRGPTKVHAVTIQL